MSMKNHLFTSPDKTMGEGRGELIEGMCQVAPPSTDHRLARNRAAGRRIVQARLVHLAQASR